MAIEFIIPTYKSYHNLISMVGCIMAQSSPDWILSIISDGDDDSINHEQIRFIRQLNDDRINYTRISGPNNDWGHTARNYGLQKAKAEWVVMSGVDNYYAPKFVEYFMEEIKMDPDNIKFIYCDMVHNLVYGGYQPIKSQLRLSYIDIGNFASRTELAKQLIIDKTDYNADWKFINEYTSNNITKNDEIRKIEKILYVHN
mgnify:FL=1